jgi:Tfp pilus assembly protein PilO
MRSSLGEYQGIVTLIIIALFIVGVSLVAYGFLLVRRTDKLVKRSKEDREAGGDA